MAVVARKTRGGRTVYWIAFYFEGRQVWERSGTDKRAAVALERKRKEQVRAREYSASARPSMRFGDWLDRWVKARNGRNAKDDRALVERFFRPRKWLTDMPCEDLRPRHSSQLVAELKTTPHEKTGKPISPKYVSNLYGLYASACKAALRAEVMLVNPCVLARGELRRKSKKNARETYSLEEFETLCPDLYVPSVSAIFAHLALFTGMREGEICGRRFRDWEASAPLACLSVASQYNDQPLKTDKDEKGEHTRRVPVHPRLARALQAWWDRGFEWIYCRKPTRDDFIAPRTADGKPHTRSSAYKLWRAWCVERGVTNRSLHSTRHTFISMCRRGGARAEVVEQITHNSSGDVVDIYTHWDWLRLCDAVMCLDRSIDPNLDQAPETPVLQADHGGGAGNRSERRLPEHAAEQGITDGSDGDKDPPKTPGILHGAARHCASQETPTPPTWVHEATANLYELLESSHLSQPAEAR